MQISSGRFLPSCNIQDASRESKNSCSPVFSRQMPHSSITIVKNRIFLRQRSACLRSEEHTSELQSRLHLVCRLLLEKKKKKDYVLLSVIMNKMHNHTYYPLI